MKNLIKACGLIPEVVMKVKRRRQVWTFLPVLPAAWYMAVLVKHRMKVHMLPSKSSRPCLHSYLKM